jgi:hypothetical protein
MAKAGATVADCGGTGVRGEGDAGAYTYRTGVTRRTCTVSSNAGLYLKVGWAGRPPAERPATHWEETPSILARFTLGTSRFKSGANQVRKQVQRTCKAGASSFKRVQSRYWPARGGRTAGRVGEPSSGVVRSADRCKEFVKTRSGGVPGNAVGIHLAELAGIAHVHLQESNAQVSKEGFFMQCRSG